MEPETTYKAYLKVYIAAAPLRGAIPVLVTPMDRGVRGTGAPTHGHGGYPQAMLEVAAEEHVAFIDLYNMSIVFYEKSGADAAKIPADGTHSTAYGGYEFARCIVMGIKQNKLGLANFIVDDFKDYNPAHPDSEAALNLGGLFSNDGGGRRMRGGANGAPPAGASGSAPRKLLRPAHRTPDRGHSRKPLLAKIHFAGASTLIVTVVLPGRTPSSTVNVTK